MFPLALVELANATVFTQLSPAALRWIVGRRTFREGDCRIRGERSHQPTADGRGAVHRQLEYQALDDAGEGLAGLSRDQPGLRWITNRGLCSLYREDCAA